MNLGIAFGRLLQLCDLVEMSIPEWSSLSESDRNYFHKTNMSLFREGWNVGEVIEITCLTEHISPDLDEDEAMTEMSNVRERVRVRLEKGRRARELQLQLEANPFDKVASEELKSLWTTS